MKVLFAVSNIKKLLQVKMYIILMLLLKNYKMIEAMMLLLLEKI